MTRGRGGLHCGTQFCLRWPLFTVPDPNPLILRPRTPAFPNLDRGTYRVMGVGVGGHTIPCMRVGCVKAIADGQPSCEQGCPGYIEG